MNNISGKEPKIPDEEVSYYPLMIKVMDEEKKRV